MLSQGVAALFYSRLPFGFLERTTVVYFMVPAAFPAHLFPRRRAYALRLDA